MQWKDRPPAPTEFGGIRLGRVQPGKDYEALITCESMAGHDTHWWKRRTVPCTAPDCAACCEGTPARWHGYLSVYSTRTRINSVLELTSLAAASVAEYEDRHGSLRGALLRANRLGNRPNSPVSVTIVPFDGDLRTLPRAVDLRRFLETIWSVKPNREDGQDDPPAGQNIRNTLVAGPPTCTTRPLKSVHHPATIEAAKSNGKGQK
jgi:hypothetical protein